MIDLQTGNVDESISKILINKIDNLDLELKIEDCFFGRKINLGGFFFSIDQVICGIKEISFANLNSTNEGQTSLTRHEYERLNEYAIELGNEVKNISTWSNWFKNIFFWWKFDERNTELVLINKQLENLSTMDFLSFSQEHSLSKT